MEKTMLIFWIALTVLFAFLEGVTAQLVSVWFVIGGIGALGAYFLGASPLIQAIVFLAVSILALILTRPFVKKVIHKNVQKTNADACIGQEAIVTKTISNLQATGEVKVGGITWTARSADKIEIPEGQTVIIDHIEGVKVIVKTK